MKIIIIGRPKSGKTTLLTKLNINESEKFYADSFITSNLYNINQKGYELIKLNFGSEYVNSKEVDRKRLSKLLLEDNGAFNKLNKLIHPLVIDELNKRKSFVAELPSFLFSNNDIEYDELVYIKTRTKFRRKRIINSSNYEILSFFEKKWNEISLPKNVKTIKINNDISQKHIDKLLKLYN